MIIEDEEAIAELIGEELADYGFDVEVRGDGDAGLEAWREDPGGVRAVILDLNIPIVSGESVLAAIRAEDPALPVVVCTGHGTDDATLARLNNLGVAAVIPKPFALAEFGRTVAGFVDD